MTDPTNLSYEELIAVLDASDEELAVGNLVPGETVIAMIETAIERLEARLARKSQTSPGAAKELLDSHL